MREPWCLLSEVSGEHDYSLDMTLLSSLDVDRIREIIRDMKMEKEI